jgi:hypothetical protein
LAAAEKLVRKALPAFLYFQEMTEVKSEIDLVSLAFKVSEINSRKLTVYETSYYNLLKYLDIWDNNLTRSIEQIYGDLKFVDTAKLNFNEIFEKIPQFETRFREGIERFNEEFSKWWGDDDVQITYETYKRGIRILIRENGKNYTLQNRSTGFRRFFGLFLSFSVVVQKDYENTVLLFDEAGAALHSLTQRKLVNFFKELGTYTQIMYNTHSSYMLPVSEMNRVRIVYRDVHDHALVTGDVRVKPDRMNEEALFPVQSSLAMHLAESTLAGCVPIMVLNAEDRTYLQTTKNVLIATGNLDTVYETLIFSTGANGIDASSMVFSGEDDLPVVLLSGTTADLAVRDRLVNGVYKREAAKVLRLTDFDPNVMYFEDMIPEKYVGMFSTVYLKELLGAEFKYDKKRALLEQVYGYAEEKGIKLPNNAREEMARRMRLNTMRYFRDVRIPKKYIKLWKKVWLTLLSY